ncbi:hypothetical protein SAY87_001768 [Trapa incisa]|uniref:Uncharacterized protein n=1 Tax=Trapa incisa TaxID=236973 RepID=A0AAN7PTQ9_9MYRT|nr:hypothetical protein SAY87_001768 [Trapa incisa]
MDAGEEEELRPSGCRKQAHNPGVPQVMGSHHADLRQRRNVEPEGGGDGEPLPGQEMYISVQSPERSLRDEYNVPDNSLLCGVVAGLPKPPPYTI